MFMAVLAIFVGWMLQVGFSKGPSKALWSGWLIAMLILPTWLVKGLGSVTLDLRTGAAAAGLAIFFLNPKEKLRYKFALMDVLVFGLFMVLVISAAQTKSLALMTVPELMRKWLLPYIVGRVFISSTRDLEQFVPLVTVILMVLSFLSFFEAGSKMNLFCKVFGKSFPILEAGEGYRWGIKRAIGPLEHPIFFGLVLVMTYPMAVYAGMKALRKEGPKWWLAVPVLLLGAVVCTASRGPIIAAMATVYCTLVFASKKLRIPLIIFGLVGGCGAVVAKDMIKHAIESSVETDDFERWVEIDGKEYRYTGTAHRELLFLVYKKAIRECPFFGYGGRLRGVPIAEHLALRFSSIDNHYLLFYLQYGKAGLYSFIAITLLAMGYLLRMAWNVELPHSTMAGSMLGALLGVSSLLMSVWFSPDHGTVWLFFVGLTTCLWKLDPQPKAEKAADAEEIPVQQTEPLQPLRRRVVPGHAPLRRRRRANKHDLEFRDKF